MIAAMVGCVTFWVGYLVGLFVERRGTAEGAYRALAPDIHILREAAADDLDWAHADPGTDAPRTGDNFKMEDDAA